MLILALMCRGVNAIISPRNSPRQQDKIMEISVEYIKAQLQRRARERQLPRVALGSGVGLRTLHRILTKGSCTTRTAESLQVFLTTTEKQKELRRAGE
jgi:hypothetical protein